MKWFTLQVTIINFGHRNIIRLTGRPFNDLEDMHPALIERWNSRIAPEDLVYYVGDISFMQKSSTIKVLQRLNGKKILIRGNHDKAKYIPEEGFQEIVEQKKIHVGPYSVLLCHYPYKGTPEEIQHAKENGYKIRYEDRRPENKGDWLIHGHVHAHWRTKRNMINVSVEAWDYYPVSEQQILDIIEGRFIDDYRPPIQEEKVNEGL